MYSHRLIVQLSPGLLFAVKMMELQLSSVVLLPFLWTLVDSLGPVKLEANKAKQNPECTDTFLKCSTWKDSNICGDDRYRAYMKYGCAKTCRYCGCRDTEQEAPYCADWKTRGFCKTYKGQMEKYCAKTCAFCGEDPDTEKRSKTLSPTSPVTTTTASSTRPQTNPSGNASLEQTSGFSSKPSDATHRPTSGTSRKTNTSARVEHTGNNFERLATSVNRAEKKSTDGVSSMMSAVRGSERGLTFKSEFMPGVWALGYENEAKVPGQFAPYGSEMEATTNPIEEGKYLTPTKSDDKYQYFTGHYSDDPFVAEAQREDWTYRNKKITGENYRKSASNKPQDEVLNNEGVVTAVKKGTLSQHAKKRTYKKQVELHSL